LTYNLQKKLVFLKP